MTKDHSSKTITLFKSTNAMIYARVRIDFSNYDITIN